MVRLTQLTEVGVLMLVLSGMAMADALNVNGMVADDQGDPIENAVVTVSFGMGGGGTQVADTTGADGAYDINTTFGGGMGGMGLVQISAAAAGFITMSEFAQVANATDGAPDTVSQDFALTPGQQPTGDSLYVSGTVTDADQDPLEGATVTVTLLTMTGTLSAQAATGAQGTYEVAMRNESGVNTAIVEASADGYVSSQVQVHIGNPDDGEPDTVTRDFALEAIVYDTLTVVGRVLDSATQESLEGALVVVSYWTGGFGGEEIADSIQTGADGRFSLDMEVATRPAEINWSASIAGYGTESGRRAVDNDTMDLGDIELTAFAVSDSLAYVVRGQVTDEAGNAMRNVDVAVLLVLGDTDTLIVDTVTTSNRGRYRAVSPTVAYAAGDVTATVGVEVDGYAPVQRVVTVASSTEEILIDVQLEPSAVVAPSMVRGLDARDGDVVVYGIDGRLLARFERGLDAAGMAGLISRVGRQPLIVRTVKGSSLQTRMLVPAR